ncbi:MAG: purine permease [bacterium]|nr:purine permease [bacterium]
MSDSSAARNDSAELIYGLGDRPPLPQACVAAFQHVLAVFVGIITPPLIISGALGLDLRDASYVVSMSLLISGIATAIQVRRIGPVGSGLLSVQGTSFTFLAPIIATATAAIATGAAPAASLGVVFGVCLAGSFVEMAVSRVLRFARRIITPLITGIVVTLIGLTLIRVGLETMCGGPAARADGTFASLRNLGLAGLVLVLIIALNRSRRPVLRMGSIAIGLAAGYAVSIALGLIDFGKLSELPTFNVPVPFKYGLGFSWAAFLPIALIYLITAIESIGDLTATSSVSGEPIEGDVYLERIQGGVLGDGVNSLLAAVFNTFPNTTFSQNNGVIQLTGVASRYVGYFIAGFLVLLGLFPVVGGLFQIMPPAVLGGATILMFGTVAAAGIRIIASANLDRRAMLILAVSLGLGLGVTFVPEALDRLPTMLENILSSGIATGGLCAIGMNVVLPRPS